MTVSLRLSCRPMSSMTGAVAVAVSASTGGLPSAVQRIGDLEERGAEIVAPLRDAVGFVDHEEIELDLLAALSRNAGSDRRSGVVKTISTWPLRDCFERGLLLARGERAVHFDRRHARLRELVDLVFHQRDQRRDDERRARQMQRGKLVAQRLARRPWASRASVSVPFEHARDHFLLARPQPRVAEGVAQRFAERLVVRCMDMNTPAASLTRIPGAGTPALCRWRPSRRLENEARVLAQRVEA